MRRRSSVVGVVSAGDDPARQAYKE